MFLDERGEFLGEDDKEVIYYILPDRLLKLVNNTSKGTAKISLKLSRIGDGAAFPETELYFPPEQFETAHHLIENLGLPAKIMSGPQKRLNYQYKDCEIALKYSDIWEWHMEIEQMIEKKEDQLKAEAHIRDVAQELGVQLMTEDELKKFTQEAEKNIEACQQTKKQKIGTRKMQRHMPLTFGTPKTLHTTPITKNQPCVHCYPI